MNDLLKMNCHWRIMAPVCQLCNGIMTKMPTDRNDIPDHWDFNALPPMYLVDHDGPLFVCVSCSEKQGITGIYTYTCTECNQPLHIIKCTGSVELEFDESTDLYLDIDNKSMCELLEKCRLWVEETEEEEIDIDMGLYMCAEELILRDSETGKLCLLHMMGEESKSFPITLACQNQECSELDLPLQSELE